MNTPQQPISAYTLKALVQKLRPSRFAGMSGVMAAIVGYVLGARFVDPSIAEIIVTSDGLVLAQVDGEIAATRLIGTYSDLVRNWLRLITAAPNSAVLNSSKLRPCLLKRSDSSARRTHRDHSYGSQTHGGVCWNTIARMLDVGIATLYKALASLLTR